MTERAIRTVSRIGGIAVVVLVLVLVLAAWTEAPDATAGPRLITVSGDAEVRVVPDEVILTLGVETWNKNMDRAKRENDWLVEIKGA